MNKPRVGLRTESKRHMRGHSILQTISFDHETFDLLLKLSGANGSAFVRSLVQREAGRREALEELRAGRAEGEALGN